MTNVIHENEYRYSFPRPALGENFRANHRTAPCGVGKLDTLPTGEEVIDLYTGWEDGDRWFVVPAGACRLELVSRGSATRCDTVRFV